MAGGRTEEFYVRFEDEVLPPPPRGGEEYRGAGGPGGWGGRDYGGGRIEEARGRPRDDGGFGAQGRRDNDDGRGDGFGSGRDGGGQRGEDVRGRAAGMGGPLIFSSLLIHSGLFI
jgi:hypothetical protein